MESLSFTFLLVATAALGQATDYGGYAPGDPAAGQQRYTVTESTRSRSVRAGEPQPLGAYPAERVAAQPRYAQQPASGIPIDGGRTASVPEDPQSLLAARLLRDMIQPNPGDVREQQLTLYEALARSNGSQQQFEVVKAYWRWNLAVAELHGVLEEEALLARVNAPRSAHEQALHQATRHAGAARVEDTRLDVAAKFVEVRQASGFTSTAALRPADVPFVSAYNTNFQRLYANNSAPFAIVKIHHTLPFVLKVVRTRADSLAAARQALGAAENAYQGAQMPYTDLLEALTLMRNQRRAFLDSVHDYNFAIAEYALTAAGPAATRETVVSMLIRTHAATPYRGAAWFPEEVRTVSVDELVDVRHYDAAPIPYVR
jgi:hypothetical protein